MSTLTGRRAGVLATVVCAGLVVVLAALLVVLLRTVPAPRGVPVGVVAPGLVSDLVAADAARLGDRSIAVEPVSRADAVRRLGDGRLPVAVVVDLAGTRDVALVERGRDPGLVEHTLDRVRAVEARMGRTVAVRRVGPAEPSARTVDRLTVAAGLLGLLVVVLLVSTGEGFPPARRRVVRGTVVVVAYAVACAAVLAALPPWVPTGTGAVDRVAVAGVLAASVLATTTAALAAVGLAGRLGLGTLALLVLGLRAPALTHTDRHQLPEPWRSLESWTPAGTTRASLSSVVGLDEGPAWRPLVVLAAWTLLALTAWAVALKRAREPAGPRRAAHTAAALAPAAALVVVAALLAPAASPGPSPEPLATRTRCVGVGHLHSVADLNRVADTVRGGEEFGGGDVGADVELQDGRRLWVFGDTVRGSGFVRNSMLLFGRRCAAVVLPPGDGPVIPNRPGGGDRPAVGYWPMAVGKQSRPGYDLVAVTTQRVRTTGTGIFDFEVLGPSVAVYAVPRGGVPQLVAQRDVGPDDADRTRPMWGAAATVAGGWLYLYGTASTPGTFGFSLRVARTRPEDVVRPSAWRYWDGGAWVADPAAAAELIPAADGTSQTLSVFRQDGRWYAVSKRNDVLGTDLVAWTAPRPTGPFTAGPPLARLPSDTATGQLRYMPLAHPDLLPRPGTVVVSYSRNRTDVGEVLEDPLRYRPRFLRVRLP